MFGSSNISLLRRLCKFICSKLQKTRSWIMRQEKCNVSEEDTSEEKPCEEVLLNTKNWTWSYDSHVSNGFFRCKVIILHDITRIQSAEEWCSKFSGSVVVQTKRKHKYTLEMIHTLCGLILFYNELQQQNWVDSQYWGIFSRGSRKEQNHQEISNRNVQTLQRIWNAELIWTWQKSLKCIQTRRNEVPFWVKSLAE